MYSVFVSSSVGCIHPCWKLFIVFRTMMSNPAYNMMALSISVYYATIEFGKQKRSAVSTGTKVIGRAGRGGWITKHGCQEERDEKGQEKEDDKEVRTKQAAKYIAQKKLGLRYKNAGRISTTLPPSLIGICTVAQIHSDVWIPTDHL